MGAIFLSNSEEESFEINFKAPRDNMFYKLYKVLGGFLFKVKFPLHLPSCICELVGEIKLLAFQFFDYQKIIITYKNYFLHVIPIKRRILYGFLVVISCPPKIE